MVPPWVEKEEEGRVIYLHLCTLAEMTKHKGSKHYVRASVELGATIVVKVKDSKNRGVCARKEDEQRR